jgi:hypothetical protein
MRFSSYALIGAVLALAVLSHGIVLVQLSHNPERGHRGPAETFRSGQVSELELDFLRPAAVAGLELLDPRSW